MPVGENAPFFIYKKDSRKNVKNFICFVFILKPEKIDPRGTGYSIKADVWSLGISMVKKNSVFFEFEKSLRAGYLIKIIID
jgi:hypothetical protein